MAIKFSPEVFTTFAHHMLEPDIISHIDFLYNTELKLLRLIFLMSSPFTECWPDYEILFFFKFISRKYSCHRSVSFSVSVKVYGDV